MLGNVVYSDTLCKSISMAVWKKLLRLAPACVPYSLPNPPPRDRVPDRKSILLWVENFTGTGSVSKKRRGRPRTSRTPENIEAVRRFVLQSPRRSARKHASALGISNRSVRRILHQDLHFHPYKMVVVQELTQQDWINPLKPELNPICYLLALLGAHHFFHVSRIRVKLLTFRLLMSYIYGAPILDVSRSHTTTQHSR